MAEHTARDGEQGGRRRSLGPDLFRTAGGEADTAGTDTAHGRVAAPPSWTPFHTAPDDGATEEPRPGTPAQNGDAMRSLRFPFEAAADASDQ
ncbi:MAG TPA: hypothetical protein VIY28_10865 [Pseudonocardiaceae bacterium]